MLIELGNHAAHRSTDGAPAITTIHIPEWDDGSTHPDAEWENGHPHNVGLEAAGKLVKAGPRLGGLTHKPGAITVEEFNKHRQEAADYRDGITQLPDHEILLAAVAAWPSQSREKPRWVNVVPNENTDPGVAEDVQAFLQEFYGTDKDKPGNFEDIYHTQFGPPGSGGPAVPDISAVFMNDGRAQQAVNYAGGQVGSTGQLTAATATTAATTTTTVNTTGFAGYRIYASVSATQMVFGNIISHTSGTNAVFTVDRWYTIATPGGSAGSTPSSTGTYVIADGGVTSAWFVGLTTTNITPAATDHSMTGEYTTAGGGFVRKIAPYALTSGTSPMTYTLTPVFTANGSDTFPSTFYAMNANVSMVVSNATLAMKFETTMSASATIAAISDQVTLTQTMTGS